MLAFFEVLFKWACTVTTFLVFLLGSVTARWVSRSQLAEFQKAKTVCSLTLRPGAGRRFRCECVLPWQAQRHQHHVSRSLSMRSQARHLQQAGLWEPQQHDQIQWVWSAGNQGGVCNLRPECLLSCVSLSLLDVCARCHSRMPLASFNF